MSGGKGDDQIQGGAGNDTVLGEGGADQIDGGQGDDVLIAGSISEGNGVPISELKTGSSTAILGFDADMIAGGDGNDLISGNAGDNKLFGDAGSDTIATGSVGRRLSRRWARSSSEKLATIHGEGGKDTGTGGRR